MSERGYFSLRYAIPGYTFILIVAAINYVPLVMLEITEGGELFGAFLALLTGSAIGWLVTQPYSWHFQRGFGILGIEAFRDTCNVLVEKYGLFRPPWNKDQRWRVMAVFDYISHSVEKGKETLFRFETRRWDMYHLLSSTSWTLWIASAVGMLLRIYYEYFFFEPFHEIPFQNFNVNPIQNAEFAALIVIFASAGFFYFLLREGRHRIISEYVCITEARVRHSEVEPEEIREAFPNITRAE